MYEQHLQKKKKLLKRGTKDVIKALLICHFWWFYLFFLAEFFVYGLLPSLYRTCIVTGFRLVSNLTMFYCCTTAPTREPTFFVMRVILSTCTILSVRRVRFALCLHWNTHFKCFMSWIRCAQLGASRNRVKNHQASKTLEIYCFISKLQYKHTRNWMEQDAMPQEITQSSDSSVDKKKNSI